MPSQALLFLNHFVEMTGELRVPLAEENTKDLPEVLTFLSTELEPNVPLSILPQGKPNGLRAISFKFQAERKQLSPHFKFLWAT